MVIRILNYDGEGLEVSQQARAALTAIGNRAEGYNADWPQISNEIMQALAGDGFEVNALQPEIDYYENKNGKKILNIKVYYGGKWGR